MRATPRMSRHDATGALLVRVGGEARRPTASLTLTATKPARSEGRAVGHDTASQAQVSAPHE
jgi:hypothetical protein